MAIRGWLRMQDTDTFEELNIWISFYELYF